jgi:hypothetical protein
VISDLHFVSIVITHVKNIPLPNSDSNGVEKPAKAVSSRAKSPHSRVCQIAYVHPARPGSGERSTKQFTGWRFSRAFEGLQVYAIGALLPVVVLVNDDNCLSPSRLYRSDAHGPVECPLPVGDRVEVCPEWRGG